MTVTESTTSDDLDSLAIEEVTSDLDVGISIKNLTKVYGQVHAVLCPPPFLDYLYESIVCPRSLFSLSCFPIG